MATAATIVIADDQALVRGGLRMILEAQPDMTVIGEASDGREALAQGRELSPDLVLMDIRMPGVDGLEATRRMLGVSGPVPKVIVLTTFRNRHPHISRAADGDAAPRP